MTDETNIVNLHNDDPTPTAVPTRLPPANAATLSLREATNFDLKSLRGEQAMCDDMVTYWESRARDVAIAIAAVEAKRHVLSTGDVSRPTRVVTTKPKSTMPKPKPKKEQDNAGS